jgi:5'-nucleotidase
MTEPLILVTNDDGISAPGIHKLFCALSPLGKIAVVAPHTERSAVGHAITLSDPLRVSNFDKNGHWSGFAVSGTPADCVKIAVSSLLDRKPDLIVSGINLGSNTGINAIYSGTVSAATEGAILGIPSIAISLTTFIDPLFATAVHFARQIAQLVLEKGLPVRTLLNINIPNVPIEQVRGIRFTRQGMAHFAEEFDRRVDLKNRVYYWLGGGKVEMADEDDADDEVVKRNFIAITPLQFDLTNYQFLKQEAEWIPVLEKWWKDVEPET